MTTPVLHGYELERQRTVGRDGVAYDAVDRLTGKRVELRRLVGLRGDAPRLAGLAQRIRAISMSKAAAVEPVLAGELDSADPYVVLERRVTYLSERLDGGAGQASSRAFAWATVLADGVAEAHRHGLAHGAISPETIALTEDGTPKLDFSGVDVGRVRETGVLGALAQAPERIGDASEPTAEADAYALATVIRWLLDGAPSETEAREAAAARAAETLVDDVLDARAGSPDERAWAIGADLAAVLDAMTDPRPERRPPVALLRDRLRSMSTDAPTLDRPLLGHSDCADADDLEMMERAPGTGRARSHDEPPRNEAVARHGGAHVYERATSVAPSSPTDVPGPSTRPSTRLTPSATPEERLGRFRLGRVLGQGGMGRVHHAEDLVHSREVAVKVLIADVATHPRWVARFHREARLLARVRSEHVAAFVDVGSERGQHFLAMEFVPGPSLGERLRLTRSLAEDELLAIAADVARGLADVHDLGIVHRDVKPSNVLLLDGGAALLHRAKLCDFGVARPGASDPADRVTEEGSTVGTPQYMAPEQVRGEPDIDARADVYALGATMFHALAGTPPYDAHNSAVIMAMHVTSPVPDLAAIVPDVRPDVAALLRSMMAKAPADRPSDGRAALEAIERLRRPTATLDAHPRVPVGDGEVVTYRFTFDLRATPARLWPYVADTERVNRAIGLAPVEFVHDEAGVMRGTMRAVGMTLDWREHPFEWVQLRRHGVLREYAAGPFAWFRSVVELRADERGGTRLEHRIDVKPHSFVGRAAAALEIGVKAKRALERVYARIDRAASRAPEATAVDVFTLGERDAFEPLPKLTADESASLERAEAALLTSGAPRGTVERLFAYLRTASAQDVANLRPKKLATHLGVPLDALVEALLRATHLGALELRWDLLCPSCRVASELAAALESLRTHGACRACNLRFELDFARSIELVFRPQPSLRTSDVGTYCIGGPAHSPHVIAQLRVAAGERVCVPLSLRVGSYLLVARGVGEPMPFVVRPSAPLHTWEVSLGAPAGAGLRGLGIGEQRLVLTNDLPREVLVRVERAYDTSQAFTAAEAACFPLFRELFPEELLANDTRVPISRASFLLASAPEADSLEVASEVDACAALDHFKAALDAATRAAGGTVVKLRGEALLASFTLPVHAVIAAAQLLASWPTARIAVHHGSAVVATLDGRLDYFGRSIRHLEALYELAAPAELVVSDAVLVAVPDGAFDDEMAPVGVAPLERRPEDGVVGHRFSRRRRGDEPPASAC